MADDIKIKIGVDADTSALDKKLSATKKKIGESVKLDVTIPKEVQEILKPSQAQMKRQHEASLREAMTAYREQARRFKEARTQSEREAARGAAKEAAESASYSASEIRKGSGRKSGKGGMFGAAFGGSFLGNAAADVAGYAARYASQAYNAYTQSVSQKSQLLAQGASRDDIANATNRGVSLGFSPADTRALQLGVSSTTGRPSAATTTLLQAYSRQTGVDANQLLGVGASVYSATGSASFRTQAEVLASAIDSKLSKGKIGEYLQVTSNVITAIGAKSFGVNTGNVADLMSALVRGGQTPGVAGNTIQSLDSVFRNPKGYQSPFVYSALSKTLQEGGLDPNNLSMGALMVQSGGLAGQNITAEAFPGYAAMGKLKHFQAYQKAYDPKRFLMNLANQVVEGSAGNPDLEAINAQQLGFSSDRLKAGDILNQILAGSLNSKESGKILKNIDPTAFMASDERTALYLQAITKFNEETIGGKIAPAVLSIQQILQNTLGRVSDSIDGYNKLFGWLSGDLASPLPRPATSSGGYKPSWMPSSNNTLNNMTPTSREATTQNSSQELNWEVLAKEDRAKTARDESVVSSGGSFDSAMQGITKRGQSDKIEAEGLSQDISDFKRDFERLILLKQRLEKMNGAKTPLPSELSTQNP